MSPMGQKTPPIQIGLIIIYCGWFVMYTLVLITYAVHGNSIKQRKLINEPRAHKVVASRGVCMMADFQEVDVAINGEYELTWGLLAGGRYKLFADKNGVKLSSRQKSAKIGRNMIRNFGIRTISNEHYFFISIGSKSPYGEGKLHFHHRDVNFLEQWVRSRLSQKLVSTYTALER